MFASTSSLFVNIAFPDTCKVPSPGGPIPTPFPNLVNSESHIPNQSSVIIDYGLAENIMVEGTVSTGDELGTLGGIFSNCIVGPDQYITGSTSVMIGGLPAAKITSATVQNCGPTPNAVGMSLIPGQFSVVILS